jgi:MFS family permease
MFNVTYFFSLIGLKNAFQSNVIVLCVLMGGVLASFYLVDKAGRRPLLLGGGVIMSICVLIVGVIGTLEIKGALPNVMVAVVCIWVIAYALSCAPIGKYVHTRDMLRSLTFQAGSA